MRAYERGEVNLAAAPDVVEKRGCAGSGEVETKSFVRQVSIGEKTA